MNTGTVKNGAGRVETRPVTNLEDPIRLPLVVHEGHLIVEIGGRKALVDTGCPETLGSGAPLEIGGKSFPLHENFYGITVESIAEPVGFPLELVIGMDVIGSFAVTFSAAKREVVFSGVHVREGEVLVAGEFFGVPTIPIVVNGATHNVIFDTGAPTSYLSEPLLRDFEFVETRTDFFPLKGTFETDIYKVPVTIGATARILEVGAMTGVLAEMLEPSRMPGILGTEILRYTDVTLEMARDAITLAEREAA